MLVVAYSIHPSTTTDQTVRKILVFLSDTKGKYCRCTYSSFHIHSHCRNLSAIKLTSRRSHVGEHDALDN